MYRIDHVIHIPGATRVRDAASDVFDNFIHGLPEPHELIFQQLPVLQAVVNSDHYPTTDDLAYMLFGVPGFFFTASRPVEDSWGHQYFTWLYAPTEADILPRAAEWAASKDKK